MTTATLTLSNFLLARIAEDEESLPGGPDLSGYVEGFSDEELRRIAAEWSAWERRWAAECAAKRRIVEAHDLHMHASGTWTCDTGESWWPVGFDLNEETGSGEADRSGGCSTLRLLAEAYADHADYREEWRP